MDATNHANNKKRDNKNKILYVMTIIASISTVTGISIAPVLSFVIKTYNGATMPELNSFIHEFYYTEEQKLVEHYVHKCKEKIIPIEEWKKCTQLQLYYIRNGIYAYGGRHYKGSFYNVFEWYDGHIQPKDFKDGMLNYYQNKNIANIKKIEENKEYLIK